MPRLHLANTYFEEEMASNYPFSLPTAIRNNRVYNKLQWLPFFYAPKEDGVVVTQPPPESLFSHLNLELKNLAQPHLFSDSYFPYEELTYWGASPSITQWAQQKKLFLSVPLWDCVRKVNSKLFSFVESPKLPGSQLLYTIQEAEAWCKNTQGLSVLKTCFGLSGRGHLHLPSEKEKMTSFITAEFKESRPIIAEPWVKRILDFSTQWEILQPGEISYLGMTQCINDAKGRYKETRVGKIPTPFHFDKHLEIAHILLKKMKHLGFVGNVGFDAMVYENREGKTCLHPIVEINARKTMGWVALQIQKRHFPLKSLSVSFSLNKKKLAVILSPWSF